MRKTALILLVGTMLCTTVALAEESLDEILAANYEARGGKDNIQAVQSARIKGTMTFGGMMESEFVMEWKRPEKFRLEFLVQGQTGVMASDGETVWQHMQFMGKADPEVMADEEAKDVRDYADVIDGPFMNAEKRGKTLEYLGTEEVEGSEVHVIKVTKEDGDTEMHYLDAEYFLEIKTEAKETRGETVMDIETSIGDYKEVGDLIFAHYMETKAKGAPQGQTITMTSFELDVEIDDARFAMPEVTPAEEGE
jgi:outer membrane lipoprotein-sorting protein